MIPTWLILQNEISCLPFIIPRAYEKGFKIVFNPAPCPSDLVATIPINQCHVLIMNESETKSIARQLLKDFKTHEDMSLVEAEDAGKGLLNVLPTLRVAVITLGAQGSIAVYSTKEKGSIKAIQHSALPTVKVTDTTGAGDVFIGYFLTELIQGWSIDDGTEELDDDVIKRALMFGTVAAGISCENRGAMNSIPLRQVVIGRAASVGWV